MKLGSVVISSRIRLARNFDGIPFVNKLTDFDLSSSISKSIYSILQDDFQFRQLAHMDNNSCLMLFEKHLISKELIGNKDISGFAVNEDNTISIMLNEEDHLRLQCIKQGNCLNSCYNCIGVYDDLILAKIDMAYDEKLGFLNACPTNIGTGMRASVMLFLPALTMNTLMEDIIASCARKNITVRGIYGEGSAGYGFFYQISNKTTIGLDEKSIIAAVNDSVKVIIEQELQLRYNMSQDDKNIIEDMALRAYGVLTNCKLLTYEESVDLLSKLRFGIVCKLVKVKDDFFLDDLYTLLCCAHLCDLYGLNLTDDEQKLFRAKTACEYLTDILIKE